MVGADEGLLRNIVGVGRVAQNQVGQPKDGLLMFAGQRFPRRLITASGAGDQVRVNESLFLSGEALS